MTWAVGDVATAPDRAVIVAVPGPTAVTMPSATRSTAEQAGQATASSLVT
jgi:hypothetical protein